MVKNLLEETRKYLDYFFQSVDPSSIEKAVEACLDCQGIILLTGVGKSGIIAEKIAMTLISTGTKALYLPIANFLHGDIGIVSEKDVLIMLSKSGETEELLNLVPYVQRRKAKMISVVSNAQSRLARQSDISVFLPVEKELCSFDLVPTISTQLQLIFGDVLSIALMQKKQFPLSAYALNHPSGSLGKKMTVQVRDIMLSGVHLPLCRPTDKLVDVLVELSNKKCGALLVVNEERSLLGIFTDGDLRRALQAQGSCVLDQPISSVMTTAAICIEDNMLAWDAMKQMQKNPGRWVMVTPVLKEGKVEGILRMHDIVHAGIS